MVLIACALGACSFRSTIPAPVEDRAPSRAPARASAPVSVPAQSAPQSPVARAPAAAPAAARQAAPAAQAPASEAEPVKPLRGVENAGKPGYYTVQRGDTLVRIALDHGQNWRDVARWNQIDNPNLIEVGEVLRVLPPPSEQVVVARPAPSAMVTGQPLPPLARPTPQPTPPASGAAPPTVATPPATASTAPPSAASPASADDLTWIWPAQGSTVGTFDEAKNKGIDIAGKAGDPVLAAADGRVVYAGSGLRGYGNLIILKHNNTYLTAYAHNRALLVKEDQTVRQGQKIAEMGNTDSDQVKLHFEIRRQGKPVDPVRYLPQK